MPAAPLILFVCSANACRSPMAAAIARAYARDAGIALRVASAGTATRPGYCAAAAAQDAMAEVGISLADHRSQPVSRALMQDAALVVTATDRQKETLRLFFSWMAARILSFGDISGRNDLADPIGGDSAGFRTTRDLLCAEMPRIIAALDRCARAHSGDGGHQGPSR